MGSSCANSAPYNPEELPPCYSEIHNLAQRANAASAMVPLPGWCSIMRVTIIIGFRPQRNRSKLVTTKIERIVRFHQLRCAAHLSHSASSSVIEERIPQTSPNDP